MTLRQFWKSLGAEQMSAWFAANKTCSDEPRRTCSCFCSKLVQFKSMNQEKIYETSLNFCKHIGTQSGWVWVGVSCAGASEGSSAGAGQSQATDVVERLWLTVKYEMFAEFSCFLLYAFAVFVTLGTVKCEEHSFPHFFDSASITLTGRPDVSPCWPTLSAQCAGGKLCRAFLVSFQWQGQWWRDVCMI